MILKKKNITIKQLAKKLNLSISSISRGLNGYKNISQQTKKKIIKFAKKYKYIPDQSAKRLVTNKSDTIAFIVKISTHAPDYVVLKFLAGVTLGIKNSSTELLIKFVLSEKEELEYYHKLISNNLADKFIFYRTKCNDKRIEILQKNNINFVSWGRTQNINKYSWIDMDNAKSIELLMNRLIKFGHRKIGFINIHQTFNYGYQRKIKYEEIIKNKNLFLNKQYYQESVEGLTKTGAELTQRLLNLKNPPTAIICSLDKFLMGCIHECKSRNLVLGKNISVVGFSDTNNLTYPDITYISHPLIFMGKEAVKILQTKNDSTKRLDKFKLIKPILNLGKSDGKLLEN